ncbi:MAG: OmpA family protein [Blautia sp.]|nr:OmpA family protein [Blautia sp.]
MQKKRQSKDSGFNVWRSYSDMMAGVLLLFVLIMCVTLFQAQKSYEEAQANYDAIIKERDDRIALQERYTAELLAQQNELDEQASTIQDQDDQILKQNLLLAERAAQLEELKKQLEAQAATLNIQSRELDAAKADITEKTNLLNLQQIRIDNIIGVKAEVIESLQEEFKSNHVNVNIDRATGALTLDANVMFDYNEFELTDEGRVALYEVLPIYCKVLLSDQYRPYLAEIVIDGYTDPTGGYSYNLELSQQRSMAVAQYLLDVEGDFLTREESTLLEGYLTVNGHSSANPVIREDGSVDDDASRRVEVKFRLKDDEMIQELSTILSEGQA